MNNVEGTLGFSNLIPKDINIDSRRLGEGETFTMGLLTSEGNLQRRWR